MRLDNEAVRVAIGLWLGLELCVPHQCHCGAQVDSFGRHAFVCKKAAGRSVRHHALNELVASVIFVNENENENYQKRKITIPLTKTKTKTKKY